MINKLYTRIKVVLAVVFLAGIFLTSPITFPTPMGCESSAGSVCTS